MYDIIVASGIPIAAIVVLVFISHFGYSSVRMSRIRLNVKSRPVLNVVNHAGIIVFVFTIMLLIK